MRSEVLFDGPTRSELVGRGDHPKPDSRSLADPSMDPVILVFTRILIFVINLKHIHKILREQEVNNKDNHGLAYFDHLVYKIYICIHLL